MKQKIMFLVSLVIFISFASWQAFADGNQSSNNPTSTTDNQPEMQPWEQEPLKLEVVLKKHYMDGRYTEEKNVKTVWAMEDFWATYKGWDLVSQEEGKVIFQKDINDISPYLKQHGYFGISENGELSIFDGIPNQNQVIQSFFQIDVKRLESYQFEKLKDGIKINSKETYLNTIEAYKNLTEAKAVNR